MEAELAKARRFAAVGGVASLGFGVPLFLHPYQWAKAFTWEVDEDDDLGLYFGRCLGSMAIASAALAASAVADPERHVGFFTFAEVSGWLIAATHVRGMFEGRQPLIEHLEIAGWTALAVGARRFRPATPRAASRT